MGSIHNKPVLVHIMVWRRKGDKPLSETWLIVPTPICVTTPRCFRKRSTSHSSPTQHHTVYLSFAHVKCFKILITQRTTSYKRVNASRRAMYVLASMGCPYPGLATEVKVHLWKAIGLPSLLYNLEIFKLKPEQQKFIESVQSSIIQRIVGFPKRPNHTALLQAVKLMTPYHRQPVTHCHYGGDSFKLITPTGSYKLNWWTNSTMATALSPELHYRGSFRWVFHRLSLYLQSNHALIQK